MRKLGLYIQETSAANLQEVLARVRPAVVLLHLDGGDLGAWIRQALPETFVIGRYVWTQEEQDRLLERTTGDDMARFMLSQKGAAACDAFMLFNECINSPKDHAHEAWFQERCGLLDRLQTGFLVSLRQQGKEAVGCNFGAGNWSDAAYYRNLLPYTMAAYKYIGFHAYGWPRLANPEPWWRSSLAETMGIIEAMPEKTCILTEVALTRAYAQEGHPDEGWLSTGDGGPLTIDDYAGDLAAVNEQLCKRGNVVGACLFNAAPDARWQSFAVTEELVGRLEKLPECQITTDDGPTTASIVLRLPFEGSYRMTQGFGERPEVYKAFGLKGHEGVDWALPLGTAVLACADGVVDRVDSIALADHTKDPYGLSVRIKHDGFTTIYAHLSRIYVSKGAAVKAGDRIGLSGSTGNSDGPHLHLSFRLDGADLKDGWLGMSDPMPYMRPQTTDDGPPAPSPTAAELITQAMALLVRAQELMA